MGHQAAATGPGQTCFSASPSHSMDHYPCPSPGQLPQHILARLGGSKLHHGQPHGSFTASCSRHLPVYCFGPVVLKRGEMRRPYDTAFPFSGQYCISLTFEVICREGGAEERWGRFLNLLQPVSAFALEKELQGCNILCATC